MRLLKRLLPLELRMFIRIFQRVIQNSFDKRLYATRLNPSEQAQRPFKIERKSKIIKEVPAGLQGLQENKRKTLEIACASINGTVVLPGGFFSFWRLIGEPSRSKGYTEGMEIRAGKLVKSTAGGICQLANALCWCALSSGMIISERHRHDLDLFPDDNREVPFGSGATVIYNYKDFIFNNPFDQPLFIHAKTDHENLTVSFSFERALAFQVQVLEKNHTFYQQNGQNYRRNEIWRRFQGTDGSIKEELMFTNDAKVLYDLKV